jgi:DNA-binding transcriptional MerR regulator
MSGSLDVSERGYRSIGEVLAEVQDEFPEITISKIRFLESQGLIDPERTASGYRKFYARDVERLRFILRSQKDAYLPLKVIKDRLSRNDIGSMPTRADITEPVPVITADTVLPTAAEPVVSPVATEPVAAQPVAAQPVAAQPVAGATAEAFPDRVPLWMQPKNTVAPAVSLPAVSLESGISMSFAELATAAGLTEIQLREIESFGLIEATTLGRDRIYDEDALLVTKLVAGFVAQGLEPRHLRMYRTTVDREAGLFEQVATPLIKQRNPQARVEAQRRLDALSNLGEQMRAALLRRSLRPYTGGSGGVA